MEDMRRRPDADEAVERENAQQDEIPEEASDEAVLQVSARLMQQYREAYEELAK